jgi:hypothetical protein
MEFGSIRMTSLDNRNSSPVHPETWPAGAGLVEIRRRIRQDPNTRTHAFMVILLTPRNDGFR